MRLLIEGYNFYTNENFEFLIHFSHIPFNINSIKIMMFNILLVLRLSTWGVILTELKQSILLRRKEEKHVDKQGSLNLKLISTERDRMHLLLSESK